ncbi:MAG: N-acetylmuramoyl-L-alanine amidase, partial [Myxococcales bacterium]|nr:N-acetylmuramoyl-L-alanine amidase [Myxococcales bacterium]
MKRASFAVLVVFLGGCVNQLGSGEERLSHDRSEMRVSPAELQDWARDGSWIVSPRLEAPEGVSRVGALIVLDAAGPLPALEARSLDDGVPQGDWRPLAATWSEEDHHVAVVDLADVGDGAQIRMAAVAATAIAHFRWTATVPETTEDALDDRGVAREALRSELSDLGVVTRAEWGARATRCSSRDTSKTRMAIHHTVSGATDPERELRGIQRYHMDSRGWCDVGYHFLVGQDGRVYEGRPLELLGAHVGGANTGNVGIAFIGCFDESGCGSLSGSRTPNDASLDAAAALIGRLAEVYGIDIDASAIKGHGEHAGQSTSCPGAHLAAKLDSLRARAASAGSTPPPAPAPAPTPEPEPTPEPTTMEAETPAPAPMQRVEVTITSEPSGAEVFVGDRSYG